MSEREFASQSTNRNEADEVEVAPVAQTNAVDITDLLDEIDGVLEQNAEEFVKSFVQKGGE
jgi:ubiquitin-like protein Pup